MESIQRTSGFGFYPSSLLSLLWGGGAWKEGCTIFPTDTPEITLHMREACQAHTGSDGLWPAGNPDGAACALAQHKLTPPEGFGGGSISISDPK